MLSMKDKEPGPVKDEDMVAYMNVLGHDLLNNNQVVLGYLELVQASAYDPQKVREYSRKAVSHLRVCALMMDSAGKMFVARAAGPKRSARPVHLEAVLEKAKGELATIFPARSIKVGLTRAKVRPVIDESLLSTIVTNILMDLVRIDAARDVKVGVSAAGTTVDGAKAFRLRFKRAGTRMPPFLRRGLIRSLREEDKSKTVKVTGMLFTAVVARRLGGNLEVEETEGGRPGIACTLTLKEGVPR